MSSRSWKQVHLWGEILLLLQWQLKFAEVINYTTDNAGTQMGSYSQAKTLTFTGGLSTVKHKTVIWDTIINAEQDSAGVKQSYALEVFIVFDPFN